MDKLENYNININDIVTIYNIPLLKFRVTRIFDNLCNLEIIINDTYKDTQLLLITLLIVNSIRWIKTKEFIYIDYNSKFIIYDISFDILTKVN